MSYARQKLVLLKVDFPRKNPLPEDQATKNKELALTYRVRGFPTIIVLDPAGEQIGKLGYEEGGPKAWIAKLEKIPPHDRPNRKAPSRFGSPLAPS